MIVATKAISTGAAPIVGVTVPPWATIRIAATPANRPLSAKATVITRFGAHADQPRGLEVLGRGAHLHADDRAAQEGRQRRDRHPHHDDRDQVQRARS